MTVRGMETGAKAQMSTHGWISFQPVKSHRKDLKVTMKIKQLFKKAAAMVMATVTVLSLLPTTAFAATGDVGTISFTRTYDSAGNVMYYNSSAVINGYTAGGTGKNKYRGFSLVLSYHRKQKSQYIFPEVRRFYNFDTSTPKLYRNIGVYFHQKL